MGLDFANPFGMAAGFAKTAQPLPVSIASVWFCRDRHAHAPAAARKSKPARVSFATRCAHQSFGLQPSAKPQPRNACKTHARWRARSGSILVPIRAEDRIADYETGAARFADWADYLTVNISSPNTPGLRDLQSGEAAGEIMRRVRAAAPDIPVLVKIAPDMRHEEAIGNQVALAENIDGHYSIPLWRAMVWRAAHMPMGRRCIGRAAFDAATDMLRAVYRAVTRKPNGGKLTLIGVGGVSSAAETYAKIRASASLVQHGQSGG